MQRKNKSSLYAVQPFTLHTKVSKMERREDSRVRIGGEVFVTREESKRKIGRVIDISRGGLAFYYLETESMPDTFTGELGIWLQEKNLFLPDISARTISDIEVKYNNPMQQIPLRRRSVQFRNLPFEQAEQLYAAFRPIPSSVCGNGNVKGLSHFYPM